MEEKRANICSRFHYLIKKLLKLAPSQSYVDEKFHFEYLNYWINYELHKVKDNIDPKVFLQDMRVYDPRNPLLSKLNPKLSYIDEDEIKNMYSLFYLYKDYIYIKDSITGENANKEQFLRYTKHCVDKYQPLEKNCLNKTTSFCKALCNFRKKYEEIKLSDEIINDWADTTLPSLSKYANAQVNDPQLSSTLVHPALADTESSGRVNRNPEKSSESQERDNEVQVTPGFTSLGSRFRSQNKGKKYIKDNFDQQSNNFLDTSEYQYTPEENMSYNISYNSV
ncbi:hypothetical protein PVMG_05971 [Plasmodium vivax Mauritania I]|uniref:VIR protein n=1 Tax=Plasmodium vivax Mauritania I TaxID=1035515 RepID=A0A0J9TIN6_PLAVI|nr:hypothetical protein PVMG_05971 [Plasmodium vivax Mauritania I]